MEKDLFLKDYLVSRLISFGKEVDGYGHIYFRANEDLLDTFLDVDFANKDVFSVQGSSDQVLTARYLGASRVDSFDYNRLPLYYFYLRIWAIDYKDALYPEIFKGNNWLRSLLKMVKPRTGMEAKALKFFADHIKDRTNLSRLFYDIDKQPEGRTIYTKASELKDCTSPVLDFYNYNLFEAIYHEITYDILLISNILEWARNDPKKLEIARDNIYRLLKPGGIVICSNLINQPQKDIDQEIEIFSDGFTYDKKDKTYTFTKI